MPTQIELISKEVSKMRDEAVSFAEFKKLLGLPGLHRGFDQLPRREQIMVLEQLGIRIVRGSDTDIV